MVSQEHLGTAGGPDSSWVLNIAGPAPGPEGLGQEEGSRKRHAASGEPLACTAPLSAFHPHQ